MKKLQIQLLLQLHGLQHVVDYLKLDAKVLGDLVLLKYRQLDADWTKKALLDCRGLILDRSNDWKVVSYPYEKFFNIGEGYCAPIDWATAKFYTKEDGSLINLYYYNDQWNVQTSGTIDASAHTNDRNLTFRDLFWKTVKIVYGSIDAFVSKLNTEFNYMFELCTPDNIVVTPHADYKLVLHGVRDMNDFSYVDIETTGLIHTKAWDLASIDEMLDMFQHMTWMEEGFVVCDANYNRAKCKNPKYVAVHHTKSGVSPYEIMNVIKTNEIDEFCVYFKEKTEYIYQLKDRWDFTHKIIQQYYDSLKHIDDQKDFALKVFEIVEKPFTGIMFALRNNHIHSVFEGMCKINNRFWYSRFNLEIEQNV